jgi:hypothetical protein
MGSPNPGGDFDRRVGNFLKKLLQIGLFKLQLILISRVEIMTRRAILKVRAHRLNPQLGLHGVVKDRGEGDTFFLGMNTGGSLVSW